MAIKCKPWRAKKWGSFAVRTSTTCGEYILNVDVYNVTMLSMRRPPPPHTCQVSSYVSLPDGQVLAESRHAPCNQVKLAKEQAELERTANRLPPTFVTKALQRLFGRREHQPQQSCREMIEDVVQYRAGKYREELQTALAWLAENQDEVPDGYLKIRLCVRESPKQSIQILREAFQRREVARDKAIEEGWDKLFDL